MKIDSANGADGAKAAHGQEPKRGLPQQKGEGLLFDLLIGRRNALAIGKLTDIGRFVFQDPDRDGPGQQYAHSQHLKRHMKSIVVGDVVHQQRSGRTEKPHADVHHSHSHASLFAEPLRDDHLMGNGAGENVADGVNEK